MSIKISDSNSKLGKIPNFSLPPVKSCPNNKFCAAKCYALKSYKQYPNVRTAWDGNYEAVKANQWLADMDVYLLKRKPRFFRIHVSGDFFTESYYRQWLGLMINHPKTKFLAFTKVHELASIPRPDNFQLVLSLFPSMPYPDRHGCAIAFAGNESDYEQGWLKDAIECPSGCDTCGACWGLSKAGIDVRFAMH